MLHELVDSAPDDQPPGGGHVAARVLCAAPICSELCISTENAHSLQQSSSVMAHCKGMGSHRSPRLVRFLHTMPGAFARPQDSLNQLLFYLYA